MELLLQNLSHKFLLIRDLHIRCIKEEEHVSINAVKAHLLQSNRMKRKCEHQPIQS
jgi:hypothetical protein